MLVGLVGIRAADDLSVKFLKDLLWLLWNGLLHSPGGGIHSAQILHYAKLSVLDAFNLSRVCGSLS
jgi:hypothetical protein